MAMTPRLSIGLPVYNGQNYLAESLTTLLAQTFEDFELIISDNASTDDTERICRRFAADDSRIRYVRQGYNIGSAPNHNHVADLARGRYFKWASHDDVYGRDLLLRCVEALDAHPEAVLSHVDQAMIDQSGNVTELYDYRMATDSPDPAVRFRDLLYGIGGDDEYGVIRTDVIRRVGRYASYHNPGRTFVSELALNGPFVHVPELLYFRRDHDERCDRLPSVSAVCANLDPARAGQSTAHLVGEYLWGFVAAIRRAPLSSADRRRCFQVYAKWLRDRAVSRPLTQVGALPSVEAAGVVPLQRRHAS